MFYWCLHVCLFLFTSTFYYLCFNKFKYNHVSVCAVYIFCNYLNLKPILFCFIGGVQQIHQQQKKARWRWRRPSFSRTLGSQLMNSKCCIALLFVLNCFSLALHMICLLYYCFKILILSFDFTLCNVDFFWYIRLE